MEAAAARWLVGWPGLAVTILLWGLTNPLLKRGAEDGNGNGAAEKSRCAWLGLIGPLAVNQIGSVIYYVALAGLDLTVAG